VHLLALQPLQLLAQGGDTNIQLQKLTVNLCMEKGNKLKGVRTMGKTSNLQTSEGRKQKNNNQHPGAMLVPVKA